MGAIDIQACPFQSAVPLTAWFLRHAMLQVSMISLQHAWNQLQEVGSSERQLKMQRIDGTDDYERLRSDLQPLSY